VAIFIGFCLGFTVLPFQIVLCLFHLYSFCCHKSCTSFCL